MQTANRGLSFVGAMTMESVKAPTPLAMRPREAAKALGIRHACCGN